MNKQLDTCFDRVEKALGTLIDSIAKYNPSTTQVQELGNADIELNKGLKDCTLTNHHPNALPSWRHKPFLLIDRLSQSKIDIKFLNVPLTVHIVQTHQSNYQRLQDLRASTAKYDAQIKDTLRLLANTRKELVHANATIFPDGPNYEIRYDELLSYARRISKTTIPPVGAVNAITAAISDEASQLNNNNNNNNIMKSGEASAPETAATTPAGGTPNGATPQPQPQPQSLTATANGVIDASQNTTTTNTNTDLPEPLATFLNPHSAYTFVPWPSEEQVRHGAIAALAFMAEQGIEAEGYDPEAERARKEREEEERKAAEERERLEREERERKLREEQARIRAERQKEEAESWRRASVSTGGAVQQQLPPPPQQQQPGGGGPPASASSPTQSQQPKAQFQFMGDDDDDDDD